MKVYVIKSLKSNVTLAEIRTDGNGIDFVVDNTDGKLPNMVKNSFSRLKSIISKSSNMFMEEPSKPVAHLLRYLLDNGDVIEITTDGKTAILNGKLLQEAEKNAILNAIRSGDIKVSQRANIETPIPVLPTIHQPKTAPTKPEPGYDSNLLEGARKRYKEIQRMKKEANVYNDEMIEKADLSDLESRDDEGITRNMMYYIKYGAFKGGFHG